MTKGIKGFRVGHAHSDETKRKIGEANSRKVNFNCDYCKKVSSSSPSEFSRKVRHFCSSACYFLFRKELMPIEEHGRWTGGVSDTEAHRRWKKKNPEKMKFLKSRESAHRHQAEGSHTFEEWKALKASCGYKCVFCSSKNGLSKDHIKPLSKGGSDYIDNIQVLCRSCNSKKSAIYPYIYQNKELLND